MSIYRRPDSKVYYMRYEKPDGTKIRRSTKQTNKKNALEVWTAVVASLEIGTYVQQDKRKRDRQQGVML